MDLASNSLREEGLQLTIDRFFIYRQRTADKPPAFLCAALLHSTS